MTREEVIERLKLILETDIMTLNGFNAPHEPLEKEIEALKMAIKALEQEPRKGHWITKIKSDLRGDKWPTNPKCSECGREPYYSNTIYNYKFCPYCGADMREVEDV